MESQRLNISRRGRARGWLLALLLAFGIIGLCSVSAASEEPVPPEPLVLRADGAGIVLEWRVPAFSQHLVTGDDGRLYSTLDVSGWVQTEVPGQPQLPFAAAQVVVPPTGDVTLHVQVLERDRRLLSYPVAPAPAPVPFSFAQDGLVGSPPGGSEWVWARDERTYTTAGPHPAEIVTLEEAGWMRGRRLMRLTFYPLRFDPAGPALEVARHLRVELRFQDKATGTGGWASDDPFIPVLQHTVVNPAQVTQFARPERPAAPAPLGLGSAQSGGLRYKLIISREGIYELTRDALIAAGVPVTTTAYRLEHAGEEVAYQWESDGDGVFEPGERILFYARPTFTPWANYDVYWLTVGVSGTQVGVRTGDPTGLPPGTVWATAVAEQNDNYLLHYASGRDGDRWYWDRLYWDYITATGERDKGFNITLSTPDGGALNATLRVYLQGTTRNDSLNPDHRVQVWLNDHDLGVAEWDGAVYHTATFYPLASLLQAGSNSVRLRLPGNGASGGVEEVWLDALELRYGVSAFPGDCIRVEGEAGQNQYTLGVGGVRIYDVTSLTAPRPVTPFDTSGGSVTFGDVGAGTATYYLLAENQIAAPDEIVPALTLTDPPGGADYLIIAHSNFTTAVAPLAAHRASSDGLRVFSTTVEAVYDAYSSGVVSPTAIRDYIYHAYYNWVTPTLSYVLLVGDGVETGSAGQYIPPYMLMVYPEGKEFLAASDNRFVTVEGSDNLPDLSIGRLPVNTVTEAETVVEKILSYELNPPGWPWNERVLFFADGTDPSFLTNSDNIYYFRRPSTLRGRRVYYCIDSNCDASHLYDDMTAAHDATVAALNSGGLLASYVGHSSEHQWAVDPQGKPMFHLSDVANLRNDGALPVFLELTCYTSWFSHPSYDTLDESLLRLAGGGAVATWGPTTEGSSTGHSILHEGFYNVVFNDPITITRLGPATVAVKASPYLDSYGYADLRDTFVLFGDPAMDLNLDVVPWTDEIFLPLVMRSG